MKILTLIFLLFATDAMAEAPLHGLLMQTLGTSWFFTIDMMGVIGFAISGLILAYRERAHLFGALVLATMPAVGGGIIRDLIAGRSPLGIMTSPHYILVILTVCLGGYIILKILKPFHLPALSKKKLTWLFEIFDALGLAAFTITGVVVAVGTNSQPLWMWGPILAVITTTGGGILRDLCRKDRHIEALRGSLYAEITIFWGLGLSLFLMQKQLDPGTVTLGIMISLGGGFLTRILAILYELKSPLFGNEDAPR